MSKQAVLAEVRQALANITTKDPLTDVPQVWQTGQPTNVTNPLELFINRLLDYKAKVIQASVETDVPILINNCLQDASASSCCIPPDLNRAWLKPASDSGAQVRVDDPPLSKAELDGINAVITTCCVCMAETGTIVLNHDASQGRRIISLLPDTHICVVYANQIASDVPEAMAVSLSSMANGQPITWISGPSATSDIELSRVEGVHGPRNLYVIIVGFEKV